MLSRTRGERRSSLPRVGIVIPARWESTRFPGKPLHPIAGKLLVQHVWERCRTVPGIERVAIATDDRRIAAAATKFGAEAVLTSRRHRSGTDRVAEAAKAMRGLSHVVNVQGDEPLIHPSLIAELVETLTVGAGVEMVTAANIFPPVESPENPHAVKVVLDREGNAIYFSRSQIPFPRDHAAKVRYYRHQGIYGYSIAFLQQFVGWRPGPLEKAEGLEQLRALENGARVRVVITRHSSIGVDTPADVPVVEKLLRRK